MSEMNVNQLLAQMRAMSLEAGHKPKTVESGNAIDFASVLKQSVDAVNENQQVSAKMASDFETGESEATLADVMISMQKASISFQAMVQVRNKLVDAYKDVMNMPM